MSLSRCFLRGKFIFQLTLCQPTLSRQQSFITNFLACGEPINFFDKISKTWGKAIFSKVTYMLCKPHTPYQLGAGVYDDRLSISDLEKLL